MSPSIERSILEREQENIPLVIINLADNKPFDPQEFDQLVKSHLVSEEPPGASFQTYALKYIVCSDVMYIFTNKLDHDKAGSLLRSSGVKCSFQSAGAVSLGYIPDADYARRTIDDYSSTLSVSGELSRRASDEYKKTVIKELLQECFQIK